MGMIQLISSAHQLYPMNANAMHAHTQTNKYMQVIKEYASASPLQQSHLKDQLRKAQVMPLLILTNEYLHELQKEMPMRETQVNKCGQNKIASGQDKIVMYMFQIANFLMINDIIELRTEDELNLLLQIMSMTVKAQQSLSTKTMKHAYIFYFNYIKRNGNIKFIISFLKQVLSYHFSKKIPNIKSQQEMQVQLQWLGYIFEQISHINSSLSSSSSFIEQFYMNQPQINEQYYYLLHMLSNYQQNMIDKRCTTELIVGHQCTIADIKEMYANKTNITIYKLTPSDVKFICNNLFKQCYEQYVKDIRHTLSLKQEYSAKGCLSVEVLMEILSILHWVTFIGGYNKQIQDLVIQSLLESHQYFFNFFQLSYIIYKHIQMRRIKQPNIKVITSMNNALKDRFFQMIGMEVDEQLWDKMDLSGFLLNGQLASILRLITNLIHINHRAMKPFQANFKYLHMVLSLSHISQTQVTMKEWAIMIIRNMSQISQILRQEIGKVQMECKIQ